MISDQEWRCKYLLISSLQPILPHEFEYDSEQEESMSWMEERTKQVIVFPVLL